MSELIRVFQKDAVCPKCGEEDIAVRWCPGYYNANRSSLGSSVCKEIVGRKGLNMLKDGREPLVIIIKDEHMERVCKTCGYGWIEIPLDQAPALHQLASQAEDDH